MKPSDGKVLILPDKPAEFSKGGIIIPETAKRDQDKGVVVSIGDDIDTIKPGDRVLFFKSTVHLMDVNGINHVMVDIDYISAIL